MLFVFCCKRYFYLLIVFVVVVVIVVVGVVVVVIVVAVVFVVVTVSGVFFVLLFKTEWKKTNNVNRSLWERTSYLSWSETIKTWRKIINVYYFIVRYWFQCNNSILRKWNYEIK